MGQWGRACMLALHGADLALIPSILCGPLSPPGVTPEYPVCDAKIKQKKTKVSKPVVFLPAGFLPSENCHQLTRSARAFPDRGLLPPSPSPYVDGCTWGQLLGRE